MEQEYLIGALYEAQEAALVVRVLYEDEWLEGIVTIVQCVTDEFDIEMPGEYCRKGLAISKVNKVEKICRDVAGLKTGHPVKIWVDDLRPVPKGYVGTKSVNETISLIEQIEKEGGGIELIDLDHDLGDWAAYGGDAIKILDYLAERETFYPIVIHTANPVGRANMERMIQRFWP